MKYFRPERFVRLQDVTEEESTLAAIQDWEVATVQYSLHLNQIVSRLPNSLRSFVRSGSLHDAEVLAIWQESPNRLKLVVQRDNDPAHVLVLGYALAEPPRILEAGFPEALRTETPSWLYDEIAIGMEGKKPVFTHNILLSNGCEIELRFHRMTVARNPGLLPSGADARLGIAGAVPQSA